MSRKIISVEDTLLEKYEVIRCDKCGKEIPEALVNWRDPYADVHIICKGCYEKCQKEKNLAK